MTVELLTVIVSVLFGGSGFLVALLNNKQMAKKDELEALRTIIEAVQKENERLRSRLQAVEENNTALEIELRLWKRHASNLSRQLIAAGAVPENFPSEKINGMKRSGEI